MNNKGFTLLEQVVAMVIISMLTVGLTLLAISNLNTKKHGDQIRYADQYGNDAIEIMIHELRNSDSLKVRRSYNNFDVVTLYSHDMITNRLITKRIEASWDNGITINNDYIQNMRLGNNVTIVKFRLIVDNVFATPLLYIRCRYGKRETLLKYEGWVYLKNKALGV